MVNSEKLLESLKDSSGHINAAEAEAVCRMVEAEMNFGIVCAQLRISQAEKDEGPKSPPDLKLVN